MVVVVVVVGCSWLWLVVVAANYFCCWFMLFSLTTDEIWVNNGNTVATYHWCNVWFMKLEAQRYNNINIPSHQSCTSSSSSSTNRVHELVHIIANYYQPCRSNSNAHTQTHANTHGKARQKHKKTHTNAYYYQLLLTPIDEISSLIKLLLLILMILYWFCASTFDVIYCIKSGSDHRNLHHFQRSTSQTLHFFVSEFSPSQSSFRFSL